MVTKAIIVAACVLVFYSCKADRSYIAVLVVFFLQFPETVLRGAVLDLKILTPSFTPPHHPPHPLASLSRSLATTEANRLCLIAALIFSAGYYSAPIFCYDSKRSIGEVLFLNQGSWSDF